MNINNFSCNILKQKVQNILGQIGSLEIEAARYLGVINNLKKEFSSKSIEELLREEKYRKIFLGGLNRDLQPSPSALATFYGTFYNTHVDVDRLKKKLTAKIDSLSSDSTMPEKLFAKILPVIPDDPVLKLFEATQEAMKIALAFFDENYNIPIKQGTETVEVPLGNLATLRPGTHELKSAEEGVEIIENLLGAVFAILPDYNEDIFRFISLVTIPRFYAEKTHPYIKNKVCEALLRTLMGWYKLFTPEWGNLSDEYKDKYSIYGHLPNTFGSQLVEVVDASWKLIDSWAFSLNRFGVNLGQPSLRYFMQALEYLDKIIPLESPIDTSLLIYAGRLIYRGKYPWQYYYALNFRCCHPNFEDSLPIYHTVALDFDRISTNLRTEEYIRLLKIVAPQMYFGIAGFREKDGSFILIFNTTDPPKEL